MACDIFSIACVCMLGAFVAFICVRRPNLIFFTLHYITLHYITIETPFDRVAADLVGPINQ